MCLIVVLVPCTVLVLVSPAMKQGIKITKNQKNILQHKMSTKNQEVCIINNYATFAKFLMPIGNNKINNSDLKYPFNQQTRCSAKHYSFGQGFYHAQKYQP